MIVMFGESNSVRIYNAAHNKSLDASGGSVFRNIRDAVKVE